MPLPPARRTSSAFSTKVATPLSHACSTHECRRHESQVWPSAACCQQYTQAVEHRSHVQPAPALTTMAPATTTGLRVPAKHLAASSALSGSNAASLAYTNGYGPTALLRAPEPWRLSPLPKMTKARNKIKSYHVPYLYLQADIDTDIEKFVCARRASLQTAIVVTCQWCLQPQKWSKVLWRPQWSRGQARHCRLIVPQIYQRVLRREGSSGHDQSSQSQVSQA